MLNNPFCYVPSAEIAEAARALSARIDASPELSALFAEGKMLGVLQVERPDGTRDFLYAFSGRAGEKSVMEGFVPPIFDYDPAAIVAASPEESKRLQRWLFEQYVVLNGRGERRSILEIFADRGLVPPGGTGDCAAPKLLQAAFQQGCNRSRSGSSGTDGRPARRSAARGVSIPPAPASAARCSPICCKALR